MVYIQLWAPERLVYWVKIIIFEKVNKYNSRVNEMMILSILIPIGGISLLNILGAESPAHPYIQL